MACATWLLLAPPMLILLYAAAAAPIRDNDSNCAHWADIGECDKNPGFMQSECAASCTGAMADEAGKEECLKLVQAGRCHSDVALVGCRASCFRALKANLTEDLEGNCFYWATDGECDANPQWMRSSCKRSCEMLHSCAVAPETAACARSFECPLERDRDDPTKCAAAARRGECRSGNVWTGQPTLSRCPYSCAVIDPPSASKAVTRPMIKRSPNMDARVERHHHGACHHIGLRRALLSGTCPNVPPAVDDGSAAESSVGERISGADLDPVPWRRRWRRCPRVAGAHERMTRRIMIAEMPEPVELPSVAAKIGADGVQSEPPVWVQIVSESPRVRLIHNFVTAHEAEHLIKIASPHYHRSSTARAGSDDKRTSNSATLSSSDRIVSAVRHRIAFYCGYPEPNLEPLQAVRYRPGEFYKPHHDYYNACETWMNGNRHFTFLIYLNKVEGEGGETGFPHLNISVTPSAFSALVFNNVLDNGEPDERTLHEGVPPTMGTKFAINGWVRSKHLGMYGA